MEEGSTFVDDKNLGLFPAFVRGPAGLDALYKIVHIVDGGGYGAPCVNSLTYRRLSILDKCDVR